MEIRLLRPEDADAYVAVREVAVESEPAAFGAAPGYDHASTVEFVHRAVADPERAFIVGAFAPALVGTASMFRNLSPKQHHRAIIWGMYVAPEHRGEGLGRQLLTRALEEIRKVDDVTHVFLSVTEGNTAARQLYERAGFETWGSEPAALRVGDELITEHHLVLRLHS